MTVISPPRHIAWTIPPTGLISPIRSSTNMVYPYLHSLWVRLLEPRMLRGKSLLLLSCTPSHRSERRPGA